MAHQAGAARTPHPVVFMVLYLPFGMSAGFVTVTLVYQLAHAGVSTAAIGALIALSYVPQTWKVLWAPLVDSLFTSKAWHLASTAATAVSLVAIGQAPMGKAGLPLLSLLVAISSLASTFIGMSADSLMAHATSPDQKGRASGWAMAGNVGGAGLGGGLGLVIATHVAAPWAAGAVVGLASAVCLLGLAFTSEPAAGHRSANLVKTFAAVVGDVWRLARSRQGYLAMLLFLLPLGTGAAGGLFPAVAGEWRASADLVALLSGLGGGVLSAVGAVAGGYLCDRMDRRAAYALAGLLMGACALAMALSPRTPAMFVLFVGLYALINGLVFAAYFAVVLEAIGKGAAATKCNLLASLANAPVAYMSLVEGQAQTRFGSSAMLMTEAGAAVAAVALFYLIFAVTGGRRVLAPATA